VGEHSHTQLLHLAREGVEAARAGVQLQRHVEAVEEGVRVSRGMIGAGFTIPFQRHVEVATAGGDGRGGG
jgi:hypothetical protein